LQIIRIKTCHKAGLFILGESRKEEQVAYEAIKRVERLLTQAKHEVEQL